MIKITAEKTIVRGEKCFHILDIEALKKEDLPDRYIEEGARCWLRPQNPPNLYLQTEIKYYHILRVGEVYNKKEMKEMLSKIALCGKRLKAINEALKKENAEWEGKKEIKI